jgi:hypothetical protein
MVGSLRPTVRGARFVAPARRPGSSSLLSRAASRRTLAIASAQSTADRRAPLRAVRRATQGIAIERHEALPGARLSPHRFHWSAPRHDLHGSRAGIAAPWRG